MERKTVSATVAVLLLLLLVVSPLSVAPVEASGYDYGYGAASVFHACDANPTTITELRNVSEAFSQIYDLFRSQYVFYYRPGYGWVPIAYVYGHLQNYMEGPSVDPYSTTTVDNVLGGIDDSEDHHTFSTFLYVGHTNSWKDSYWQKWRYGFYMNKKGYPVTQASSVNDTNIRSHAEDNHHFVFLWVCRCGYERGSENNPPQNPPNGMPHCWTQGLIGPDSGVPPYGGYDSPDGSNYCFIGFAGASPRLEEMLNGPTQWYKHWLVFFYYFALYYGTSVNQALDHASWASGFANFATSKLYIKHPDYPLGTDTYWLGGLGQPEGWYDAWMLVYGDGNVHLPIRYGIYG